MATANKRLQVGFDRHFEQRLVKARALTPGQKKVLIAQLLRELEEEGRVPLPSGPVRVDIHHPTTRAALEGRPVVMGGKTIQARKGGVNDRVQGLSTGGKVALLAAVFLVPLLVFGLLIRAAMRPPTVAAAVASATPSVTPSPTASPTATATGTASVLTPTVQPTVPVATPTPYALALTTGAAAPSHNDPASIEVAGYSYILGTGQVVNGQWQPQAAEWLAGSTPRRVVAVPWEPDLANAVATLRAGGIIKLRLRSGEIVKYKVTEIARVQRQQIEVLASRTPSLAVVLYGEPSDERLVILASAVQEPQDFTVYTSGDGVGAESVPAEGAAPPDAALVPTLVPTTTTDVLTSTRTLTDTTTGLALTVGACRGASNVQGQVALQGQRFYVCEVTLRATGTGSVRFSAQALAITEQGWLLGGVDWKPEAPVTVTDALGSGTLTPGNTTSGRIVGIVQAGGGLGGSSSAPVLVWQASGTRYIIQLTP